jgi:ribonuclease HII
MPKESIIAGTDEAGRGPLVGSVVAAAVILDSLKPIAGLNDSKKLSEKKREYLFEIIIEKAQAFSIAESTHEEIDQINILQASLLAMKRAVMSLNIVPNLVLVDGNRCPVLPMHAESIIQGDSKIQEIMAASILAKVTRDRQMAVLHEKHPEYGFIQHKGYPTKSHIEAIQKYGVLPEHRKTFSPVALYL